MNAGDEIAVDVLFGATRLATSIDLPIFFLFQACDAGARTVRRCMLREEISIRLLGYR
jgi:hypothetical protein